LPFVLATHCPCLGAPLLTRASPQTLAEKILDYRLDLETRSGLNVSPKIAEAIHQLYPRSWTSVRVIYISWTRQDSEFSFFLFPFPSPIPSDFFETPNTDGRLCSFFGEGQDYRIICQTRRMYNEHDRSQWGSWRRGLCGPVTVSRRFLISISFFFRFILHFPFDRSPPLCFPGVLRSIAIRFSFSLYLHPLPFRGDPSALRGTPSFIFFHFFRSSSSAMSTPS
jgi:hypothetical protein